ncbi:hypothetical protein JAAARDRAFT_131855 [Jaapia argillacea MUCL 33604]|uniref:AB hydrolase-1 domain-containing protein n=1 Tax=Jaapia argillacea MUCL 33604 TaxID=933084 RepID=A0A067Q2T3_9AGAM|nr:hypothetical protein JAAARDRAFT_131855 [Jaapia argillacea MUCL 33604]
MQSFPKPTVARSWPTVNPRPLVPIESPPGPLDLPSLPSPPRSFSFESTYTLTTHIIPAAYPRSTPDVTLPVVNLRTTDKEVRKANVTKATQELLDIKDKSLKGELVGGSRKVLWNCVNRYVRKGGRPSNAGKRSVTLFCLHANGFPKEIWEPTLKNLVASTESSPLGPQIDEIWTWEAVQHGDSAILNEKNLGALFDWRDNTRDILNFLLNYLPSSATSGPLPTHLTRLPKAVSESRKVHGFQDRTFFTVGHSLGGGTSCLAAYHCPALFPTLVLVDPVILPVGSYDNEGLWAYVSGAIQRRDSWASREEALRLFSAVPFFAAWDPEVLKIYVECALRPNPDGGVQLKMSGMQEAVVFADTTVAYEVFELVASIDDRVELRWVLPGQGRENELGGESLRPYRAWRRETNVSNVIIPKAGHLIAQEAPRELAQDLFQFLQRKYGAIKSNL